ncbi:MAG TPA: type IV pilin protein [Burkholderiaceae bacterium]|nr:type IV pilin protein [Burkholderiaceae bacterium]
MKHDNHAFRAARGFTLTELIVAMAVVGVLTGIAVASYAYQITKSRRADAKSALLDLAAREERYFAANNTYTNVAANLGYGALPAAIPGGTSTTTYTLNVTAVTATSFSAQASRAQVQANDGCGDYTVDDRGTQSNVNNTLATSSCW